MDKNDSQKDKWNTYYGDKAYKHTAEYDDWIEKYFKNTTFPNNCKILDLGCGICNATQFFFDKRCELTCADYSDNAIAFVKSIAPDCKTVLLDLRDYFTFPNLYFDLIIADLSLHYFNWETTLRIFSKIYNILKKDGLFFLRLNSVNDILHGACKGEEIETNYYLNNYQYKRFFDHEAIDALLKESWNYKYEEKEIIRKENRKKLWEIHATKKISSCNFLNNPKLV